MYRCAKGFSVSIPNVEDSVQGVSSSPLEDTVAEVSRSSCCAFKKTRQVWAGVCCVILVGTVLLGTGIALCILGLAPLFIGPMLIGLGSCLLLTGLCSAIFLLKEHGEHNKLKELAAEIAKKGAEFDAAVQRCKRWSDPKVAADVWRDYHLTQPYKDLRRLYKKKEDLEKTHLERSAAGWRFL